MKAPSNLSPSASTASHPEVEPEVTQSAEAELISRCCEGDLTAFDSLVERHQDRIFNLCYWMLGNRDEAADAAQDAFVRAFRSLGSFRGQSSFGTWLHRIAVNVAIDAKHRRQRAALPYTDLVAGDDEHSADAVDTLADSQTVGGAAAYSSTRLQGSAHADEPARLALLQERRAAVRQALACLPEHYRFVLVLFDIEGHSYDDISQSLKLPLGTVKSRISRARLQLRQELQSSRELFED